MLLLFVGVLYVIYRYMHCFFDTSDVKKSRELSTYGLYLAAMYFVNRVYGSAVLNAIVSMVLIFMLTQLYSGKQGKKLMAAFMVQGMNILCAMAALYLVYDGSKQTGGKAVYGQELNYLVFLLMYICERIIEKFGIRNMRKSTALKHWDLLLFMPVLTVVVMLILITADIRNRYAGVTISLVLILLNLIVFYVCDELVGAYIRLEESALVEKQLEGYSNQLDVMMKSEEKVRGLRHDLKHHLNELMMMAEAERTEEIKAYVRDMQEYMVYEKEYVSSGNTDIDSLMNLMLDKAKRVLDDVRYRVGVPCGLDMQAFDWNIILGNLLDNAISAAAESEEKLLHIKINYRRGILFINIRNSYSGRRVKNDGGYVTTKKYDRDDGTQLHGIGLGNVGKIVEKYDGSMEIDDADGIFDVRIMMYVSVR